MVLWDGPARRLPEAPTTATPLPILAINWEQINKFRSILQAKHIEIYSCYKEQWFQIGLATKGDNIGICKACIKNTNSLKDPTLPPLFSESNGLDPGPIPGFLSVLTAVKKLLIARVYIHLQVVYIHGQQYCYTSHIYCFG